MDDKAKRIESLTKKVSENLSQQRSQRQGEIDERGRIMPQARHLEEAVLGAIMLEKESFDVVSGILKEESFYIDTHQRIYKAMRQCYEENQPIDILTVVEQVKLNGDLETVGGAYYIAALTNKIASSANLEYHSRLLAQKYLKRELISLSNDFIRDAFDETVDVFNLMDKAEASLFALSEDNLRKSAAQINSVLTDELQEIDERRKKAVDGNVLTGVGTAFTDLDRITAGWQKSDLIIVAARPGMGKTAFTLALARNAAVEFDKGVAFFSLEMSNNQLVSRLISMETEIAGDKLRKGTLLEREWVSLTENIDALQNAKIYIDDTPAINVFELRAKCRRLAKQGIDLIVIDYLQLMSGSVDKGGNREQEISQISRALKGLAKELDVPVIALSQLSRAVETRGGVKRPQLSDLRESGAIEQDADMVIFLYRPEYYGITENEDGSDARGTAEVIIAKNRHGAIQTVRLKFLDKFAKFTNNDRKVLPPESDQETRTFSSKINDDDDILGGLSPKTDDAPF